MTEKDILEYISQEEIMTRYFGEWELGRHYVNPYRKGDTSAGCWFTYRNQVLYFVDFGNEIKNINCFEMCKLHYNCNYSQALIHIDHDFKLNFSIENLLFSDKREFNLDLKSKTSDNNLGKIFIVEEKKPEYEFIYQSFQPWDISFWKRFKYTKELVELMKIRSVSHSYIDGKLFACSSKYNPLYTYSDSRGEFKLYQPYGSKFKKWSDFGTFQTGRVGFQDHGNKVWYKNIKIRKL